MLERFTWIKQSGFRWSGDGMTVYIDPWGVPDDFEPADVVFLTHAHDDHYSRDDLARIRRDDTVFVAPRDVAAELSGDVIAVGPGDTIDVRGIKGQSVPAYNIRPERLQMHPKENNWVGYILELERNIYYHAGDTDHLPELERIRYDVAFVPSGAECQTLVVTLARRAGLVAGAAAVLMVLIAAGLVRMLSQDDRQRAERAMEAYRAREQEG